MAKELKELTKRADNYSQWYNDLVVKADLAEQSAVRGCMVIKPYGYAIWEKMQRQLDDMFKATGHVNAYFPLLIPKSFLSREAEHVEGFAKECAVVTHYRLKTNPDGTGVVVDPAAKLEEELIIRPTSETIIWNTYKNWIHSYRDLLASRTGELLNAASLARDVGVDSKTVKRWLSILQASNIIYLLQPFSLNINKRIIKTPKVYFTDTGLVCYLCRWLTPETLANGGMGGSIYETFIVSEILKSYYNDGKKHDLYFFRNTDGQEVDLLFYRDGKLYPIEIKKTSSPNVKDAKHFGTLSTFFPSLEVSEGGIICNAEDLLPLGQNLKIIPFRFI